jgi:hypothetical protein
MKKITRAGKIQKIGGNPRASCFKPMVYFPPSTPPCITPKFNHKVFSYVLYPHSINVFNPSPPTNLTILTIPHP